MKQQTILLLVVAALAAMLTRECFPRRDGVIKLVIKQVPQIVTVHDTVKTTVKITGPRAVTTDTVKLVTQVTIHDTVQIVVNGDTAQRTHLWPVLNAQIGKSRGDTSQVITVNLRSGKTAVSRFWTPAPLRGIYADTTATPRLDFYEPWKVQAVSLWTKIKWTSIGYGACYVTERLRP